MWGDGVETDDVVATLWREEVDKNGVNSVVIVSIDKDYKQLPCWFYDYYYKRKTLEKIEDFEADYNFFSQMIIGDAADNVNYCKGFGQSFVFGYFEGIKSRFGLLKATYSLFLKIHGKEAREKFCECYDLLKLRTNVPKSQIHFG